MFTLVTFDNIVGIFCKNLFFVINCIVYIIVYFILEKIVYFTRLENKYLYDLKTRFFNPNTVQIQIFYGPGSEWIRI